LASYSGGQPYKIAGVGFQPATLSYVMTTKRDYTGRRGDRYHISDEKYVALRQEIIETHRSSSDFLKWKLFAVAAVASVAIGFLTKDSARSSPDARLIVLLAPLVCAYADLVNTDLAVRVMIIGNFLQLCDDPYEKHLGNLRRRQHKIARSRTFNVLRRFFNAGAKERRHRRHRRDPFNAATIASFTASLVVNVLIVLGGAWARLADAWPPSHVNAFVGAGFSGVVATMGLWALYGRRLDMTAVRHPRARRS
jgi:hypothetical protein